MPISRSFSVTGIEPASVLSMKLAASCTGWSGRTVCTSRVITSLTFMVALLLENYDRENERTSKPLRLLGRVFRQQVVCRYRLILLAQDLDGPADLAGIFRLDGLGPYGELQPDGIAGVERSQGTTIFQAGIREDRTGVGIDEQAGREAQDQIAMGD